LGGEKGGGTRRHFHFHLHHAPWHEKGKKKGGGASKKDPHHSFAGGAVYCGKRERGKKSLGGKERKEALANVHSLAKCRASKKKGKKKDSKKGGGGPECRMRPPFLNHVVSGRCLGGKRKRRKMQGGKRSLQFHSPSSQRFDAVLQKEGKLAKKGKGRRSTRCSCGQFCS